MRSRPHGILQHGALLAICCTAFATALAQSFDCSKASTAVERAICDDESLGDHDEALARAVNRVLEAEPERRRGLLADQRRWLAYRDKRCVDASTRSGCLSEVYRARIEHLQSIFSPSAAICHRIAERYRPSVSAHGQSALDVLLNSSPPALESGVELPSFGTPATELPEWAQAQNSPFLIARELIDALKAIDDGTIGRLHRLPGTNLYSITHEQGSAHCYTSQFFEVESGYARPVAMPPMIEDEGGAACGVSRGYARVEGMPAIIQRGSGVGPGMSSTEILVVWDDEMVPSACTMTSWYSPQGKLEDISVR